MSAIAHTVWCTQHSTDVDECVSTEVHIGPESEPASASLWMVQSRDAVVPSLTVETAPMSGIDGYALMVLADLATCVRECPDDWDDVSSSALEVLALSRTHAVAEVTR